MKKKEIVLITVLVIFGFLYQAIEKGKVRFVNDFSFYSDERKLKGSQFVEFPESEKLFTDVKKISIENPAGEIVINNSADDQVRVMSSLRVYYSDKRDVDEIRKKTAITTDLQNGDLKIAGQYAADFPFQRIRILFRLYVPEYITLAISNKEGETIVKGTGKDIHVNQENGSLVLENISSGLELQLRNCNANIKTITDHVDINGYRTSVNLDNIDSLRFKGEHGDCSIKNVQKDVYVEHSYGKLFLDGADKVEIHARHSDIDVKNIKNGAIITNKYENIFLKNIDGDVRLSSRLGKIDIQQITSRNIVIENSFSDIAISHYSGENLDVLLNNGNLDLQVKDVANRINIESQHAELILNFGVLSDPTFNIKTKHGQINLQTSLDIEKYEENAEIFANRSGQKPEILVNNIYGNVQIKTAN